jgi:hypothetical protein
LCDADLIALQSAKRGKQMPRITKDAWQQHAPTGQELAIPRVPHRTIFGITLAWLITGLSVNMLASALWALIAP